VSLPKKLPAQNQFGTQIDGERVTRRRVEVIVERETITVVKQVDGNTLGLPPDSDCQLTRILDSIDSIEGTCHCCGQELPVALKTLSLPQSGHPSPSKNLSEVKE
jgi:hypothetical protein